MILDLKTPDLGDADKIELVEWYVGIGDTVAIGQEILELVTDKASFPMEAPRKGKIVEILVNSGSIVQKSQILGKLEVLSD